MLDLVETLFLEVKGGLLLKNLFSLRVQSLACLLNFVCEGLDLDLLLLKVELALFELNTVCLDQLPLFL